MYFVLASKSPRRRQILKDIGLDYTICAEEVDETMETVLPPDETVRVLSCRKAKAAADKIQDKNAMIISADTVVYCKGRILGKPSDDKDAFDMLTFMSGSRHYVYTGITVIYNGKAVTDCEVSEIVFRDISQKEIEKYIEKGEHRDKAGSYGIQESGGYFVQKVNGDINNIIGLPVNLLRDLIKTNFNIDIFDTEATEEIK